MEMQPVVGLAISLVVPKILELLKNQRWAFFMQPYGPIINRVTAAVAALLTALGVTVHFDAAAGVLTIGGLFADQLLRTAITWAVNFAAQEVVYRKFINDSSPASTVMRKGGFYLLPLILALGLSVSACATVSGFAGSSPAAQQSKLVEISRAVNAADQVLAIASTIQDVEIAAHDHQRISDGAHAVIQQAFKEFAGAATQGLTLSRDLSKPETTRLDAARSVGAIGLELITRIEPHLPREVAVYLNSLRAMVKVLGFSV